jgi:streptogramin lyase
VIPAKAVTLYEYGIAGTPIPWGIVYDRNGGAVWITEQGANKIAQIGSTTYEYSIPTSGSVPWGIASSKETGDIWFTEETGGKIGRLIPTRNYIYEYSLPQLASSSDARLPRPRGITMNITRLSSSSGKTPSTDVWFTEYGRNRIGHLLDDNTPAGTPPRLGFYYIPWPGSGPAEARDAQPLNIVMSPTDYSIWFTEYNTNRIGSIRLLENGTAMFRHYYVNATGVDQTVARGLWGIGVDPNGFVWVTESERNCIGRLNPISGEYVTYTIPTSNSKPHELVVEITESQPFQLVNVWFTEHNADKIGRYDPGLNVFFEYPIISAGGRPHGITISGEKGSVWFTEPFSQKVGQIYNWPSNPIVTTTTVGTITSAATTVQTVSTTRTYSNKTQSVITTNTVTNLLATTYLVTPAIATSTQTYTSSLYKLTSTVVYSYTVTSPSTSYTTTSTTTTGTQTIVSVSSLSTTTTTTATSTSWNVQTTTATTSRTDTAVLSFTSLTTATLTQTSTSMYPTVSMTSTNVTFISTTTFSPTVTVVSTRTSVIPTTSTVTSLLTTTIVTWTTAAVTRPCIIASVAYGSELAPEVQFLRGFRDGSVMSTFAGAQFMRVFNSFYYSFSPTVADLVAKHSVLTSVTRGVIHPLIAALGLATSLSKMLPLSTELAIVFAGILSSCALGVVYVLPVLMLHRVLRKSVEELGGK